MRFDAIKFISTKRSTKSLPHRAFPYINDISHISFDFSKALLAYLSARWLLCVPTYVWVSQVTTTCGYTRLIFIGNQLKYTHIAYELRTHFQEKHRYHNHNSCTMCAFGTMKPIRTESSFVHRKYVLGVFVRLCVYIINLDNFMYLVTIYTYGTHIYGSISLCVRRIENCCQ